MTPKRRILERKEKATRTSVVGICGQERRYWTTLLFYVKKLSGVKRVDYALRTNIMSKVNAASTD